MFDMDLQLNGKSVIVTAGSNGLGKAMAKRFASEGARVVIASRNEENLKSAKAEISSETGNHHVDYVICDLTKSEDIKNLVLRVEELHGSIDVLVNNTGGPPAGDFDSMSDEDWQYAFELNVLSFVRTIRAVLPSMRRKRAGHIVNIASSSMKQPIDNLILSNTFRPGIAGLSKSLSQELGQDNILINTIGPGRIATDRVAHLDQSIAEKTGQSYEEVRRGAEQAIPLGRLGTPEEFAKMAIFLCSGANTYITGQSFLVDGGMIKTI